MCMHVPLYVYVYCDDLKKESLEPFGGISYLGHKCSTLIKRTLSLRVSMGQIVKIWKDYTEFISGFLCGYIE